MTIPCELPDASPIILAGTLVQFGERQLKCVEGSHRLKDPACGGVAFAVSPVPSLRGKQIGLWTTGPVPSIPLLGSWFLRLRQLDVQT